MPEQADSSAIQNGNGNGNGNGHNGRGRPTTYKPVYCKRIVDFMLDTSSCPFPTLELFAHQLGTYTATLVDWAKANPDFNSAYIKAKEIQRHNLIIGGLSEKFNASFSKFVGINLGMISENAVQNTNANVNLTGGLAIRWTDSTSSKE